ncbi:SGNH/GDSL hydrolase family protein [Gordonia westfalica]|uniref:SGNH/GDSL hydrolase family protein n=1 Tax=Gordonia westfalica TaxID=158898 RepID=A0ABU2GX50_9ACTN|nr:SGNH/GDSL hydrolase family protein [Gordonia westfalica]MDS1116001.1 SGNH/GDSL hydrolase family protein [Gordonia westfalica]
MLSEYRDLAVAQHSRRTLLKSIAGATLLAGAGSAGLAACSTAPATEAGLVGSEQWKTPVLNLGAKRYWQAAVDKASGAKLKGLFIGSSTAEGAVAKPWTARLSSQLEKSIQASVNPDNPGGYSLRARDGAWTPIGDTLESPYDLGLRNRFLTAGSSIVHTSVQPVTGLQILFLDGPEQSPFEVTIDDRDPIRVSPRSDTPRKSATGVWESPELDRGTHTFAIRALGPVSIGNTIFRDGDRDAGFSMYQAGHAGWSTMQFLEESAASMWERYAYLQPDLVLLGLGPNDRGIGVEPARFESHLRRMVTKIDQLSEVKPWVVIVALHNTTLRGPAAWSGYMEAMQNVALTWANVTYTSIFEFFPQVPGGFNDTDDYLSDDNIHLTSEGHSRATQIIVEQLGLPRVPAWPAS